MKLSKKVGVIIFIIAIVCGLIFFLCYIGKIIKEKGETSITDVENQIEGSKRDDIETYLSNIYLGNGIVEKEYILPEFEDINEAPDTWILNCIFNVASQDSSSNIFEAETIESIRLSLFGSNLTKELPNEDEYSNIVFDDGNYILSYRSYEPDYLYDYVVNYIIENDDGDIEVELIEYKTNNLLGNETVKKLYTMDGDTVLYSEDTYEYETEEQYQELDEKIKNYVENNKGEFTRVKLILEQESSDDEDENSELFYVKSISR